MVKINIGILGFANIAKKAIIPAILNSEKYNLIGIATSDINKVNLLKQTYDIEIYSKYDDLIAENQIDAVYIPLPNSMHYEWVKKSLNNNKHVLVEKSLACSLNEVLELCEIAKQKKLVLIENFQFRFHKQLQYILEKINDGSIGAIRNIRSSFCFPPFEDKNNIRYNKKLGGGALLDAGAYPLKMASILMGNEIKIVHSQFCMENNEVDIWGNGTITNKNNNLVFQFSFGFDNYYQCNLEILGCEGKITANRIFTAPPGYNPEIIVENKSGKNIELIENENHFLNMLNHFFECISNDELKNKELNQNILQAQLINQFNISSNG